MDQATKEIEGQGLGFETWWHEEKGNIQIAGGNQENPQVLLGWKREDSKRKCSQQCQGYNSYEETKTNEDKKRFGIFFKITEKAAAIQGSNRGRTKKY